MGLFSGPRTAPTVSERAAPLSVTSLSPMSPMVNYALVSGGGENALRSIAVGTSIDLICSLASELPLDIFRGDGSDRVKLRRPSSLDDPGDTGQGLEDFIYTLIQSWLYRGNMYGEALEYDNSGRMRRVGLFHPDSVYATVVDGVLQWTVNGKPFEPASRFVHRRVNPVAGRALGQSVIEYHASQIGTSLAASKFGEQWFTDGAHPSGLLINSEKDLDKAQATTVKQRWMSLFQGTREPAVLGKGWDWRPIQINPSESQFLETQRFTEAQCARMFGPAMAETLGYETGGSMTYANVVDRRSDLLTFTLNRWLRRAERFLTELLPAPQYARFNRDALLQSTTLARYEAHSKALADQWRTVNEVRNIEEAPPVAWGDTPNEKTTPTVGGTNP